MRPMSAIIWGVWWAIGTNKTMVPRSPKHTFAMVYKWLSARVKKMGKP